MGRGKTGGERTGDGVERGEKFWSIRGARSKSSPVSPVFFSQIVEHHKISIYILSDNYSN